MLGSMEFLERSKAVIDFETGRAIFKGLDPEQVVQLDRSEHTRHLMVDLTKDLYDKNGNTRVPRSGSALEMLAADASTAYLQTSGNVADSMTKASSSTDQPQSE